MFIMCINLVIRTYHHAKLYSRSCSVSDHPVGYDVATINYIISLREQLEAYHSAYSSIHPGPLDPYSKAPYSSAC